MIPDLLISSGNKLYSDLSAKLKVQAIQEDGNTGTASRKSKKYKALSVTSGQNLKK